MKRLDDIPVWLFALLTVAAFDAMALGGLLCTRRWGHWLGLYALVDNNTVGWIFSAILVMLRLRSGSLPSQLGETRRPLRLRLPRKRLTSSHFIAL